LDWDADVALAPLGVGPGQRAKTADSLAQLLAQVVQAAQPGDHIVCMSNGAFGGIHQQLLDALAPD
jgi:UDP-N-acetylmuramate: L-alanyl-gamma-D-glutamyl-meso-diaminopimelate ligase